MIGDILDVTHAFFLLQNVVIQLSHSLCAYLNLSITCTMAKITRMSCSRVDNSGTVDNRRKAPAASLPQNKRAQVRVSKSFSRSALLVASADLVVNHTDRADSTELRNYFSKPQSLDVCCGRGKGFFRQPGNVIFQDVIRNHLDAYEQADSRTSKRAIVSTIVKSILIDHKLRFIKKDPAVGKWYVLSCSVSHEKTGHAIRDQLTRVRRKRSPLQEKASSSAPTTISCLSSKDPKISHMSKHQVPKKIKKAPIAQRQDMVVEKEELDLLRFHLVSPEELDDPWSDQVSCTDTIDSHSRPSWGGFPGADLLVPSLSSGDHDMYPLDFRRGDDALANDVVDQM